ncbi:Suppressor of fused protein (SUFU) [Lentzea waywayandensis]|uniref:Suppressor of fused protein (SUFU) n=1 Tax=Lentzea waywayandensis TaxID=84724 RepID=A0A1I6FBI7_9PSEU|nr:Suppressor of fused protein (SUFU) [Lentzea waywayandensis]
MNLPLDELHGAEPGDEVIRYSQDDQKSVEAHYRRFFGGHYSHVWHERVSVGVHLDIYIYGATPDRPYVTLATVGMGAADVTCEHGDVVGHPIELVTYVPHDWDFSSSETQWLIRRIIEVARFPHEFKKVMGRHHTWCVYDGRTGLADALFPGSSFTHWFFRSLIDEPDEIDHLALPSGRCVNFLWAYPITRHELHFGEQESELIELETQLATYAPIPIDLNRPCLFSSENREGRRARKRNQKRLARSLPVSPWMAIRCEYPGHQRESSDGESSE